MNRNEKIKVISQAIYDDYIEKGWKNVSIYDCEVKAMNYVDTEIVVKKLTLTDVSQQREPLLAYHRYLTEELSLDLHELWVDKHLKANNCG